MSISQNYPTIAPSLDLSFALTKKLDPRVTFARASTATYYDGKTVAKAEENLLVHSQSTSLIGAISGLTTTNNSAVAPDGTTTAFTVTQDGSTGGHIFYANSGINVVNTYTASLFLKASTVQFMSIAVTDGASANYGIVTVDLSAGTITKTGGPLFTSSSIVNAGNGWHRVILTVTFISAINGVVFFRITQNSTGTPTYGGYGDESFTGTNGNSSFVWGAQLEARSTVTAYQPTTTQPITNYIPTLLTAPANVARFEHNPVTGESLGLEVEEQRTNLFTYSEDFSNVAWTKTALNLTSNTIVAPNGTLTGSKISTTSGTFASGLVSTGNLAVASSSISVYAKAGEAPILQIATYNFSNFQCYFDLTTGVSNGTAGFTRTMTNVGNGWWRCTVSGTLTAGGNFIFIPMAVNSGLNPAPIGQGIYIWGAQLEAGAFPTSYIKTVASQVTRAADSASMVGSNFSEWYRQDEGSFYLESQAVSRTAQGHASAGVSNSTAANVFYIQMFTPSNIFNYAVNGNVTQAALSADVTPLANVNYKTAFGYKTNDFASSFNGGVIKTDTSGTLPQNINMLTLGTLFIGSNQPLTGTIKKFSYYPVRISNAQLQGLTS